MLYFEEYLQTDPKKKTIGWANRMITNFRMYWKPLVDHKSSKANMDIILSRYDMANVMKMFKDPNKLGMEFIPISVMEKVRNILIGESFKAGLSANVKALDPVADNQRKKDAKLLENRKSTEEILSFLQESIGLPEYNLKNEKKINGEKPFHGNLEMFDDLGLDSDNPQDRGYFMKAWHKLRHEMDAKEIVNGVIKYNELEDHLEDWYNDIMAKKAIARQAFVSDITGAQEVKYLAPDHIRHIPGKRKDGKDSVCLGIEEPSTIGELIKKIGNDLDIEQEWRYMVNAINFNHGTNFSGIWNGRDVLYGNNKGNLLSYTDFLNFKVNVGYIEFKHFDQLTFKKGVDVNGNLRYYEKSADYMPSDEESGYKKDKWYNEYTYKSWYLPTSTYSQRLYKFGKLFHQVIEGAEDEYSSYSIAFRKVTGPSVAEIARPWIEIAQECFTKFRWMVRRSKPKGRSYNYEGLVQIAKHMIREGNTKEQIASVIQMFEEGINEIFTIPKVNGNRIGGGISPNVDLPNGLDATAIQFKDIIDWAVGKIKEDLAINDIRDAYSPKTNDVYKLQQATLESSRNATAYMPAMVEGLMRDTAKHILATTQDIVYYKDSLAYSFLLNMVGNAPLESIEELGKIALHRYGIFVNSMTTYQQRQDILRDTSVAFNNGEIGYEIKILIDSIEDFSKAAYVLAYEKQRGIKLKQQEVAQAQQNAMAVEAQKHGNKMEEINAEGMWRWKAVDRQGFWYFKGHQDDNQTKVTATEMRNEQHRESIIDKTDQTIRQKAAERNLASSEPLQA